MKSKKGVSLGWIIVAVLIIIMGISGSIGWSYVAKEHNEAKNVAIHDIEIRSLKSGIYDGKYDGGMYRWRANEVRVAIDSGRIKSIQLIDSSGAGKNDEVSDTLFSRIVQFQTLMVDAVSGATLTSKAYLKSVENALSHAQ